MNFTAHDAWNEALANHSYKIRKLFEGVVVLARHMPLAKIRGWRSFSTTSTNEGLSRKASASIST